MCIGNLFKPDIPKVEPMTPPPAVKVQPTKPVETQPDAKPLADPEEKPKLDYGSKPSDALLSKKPGGGSVVNLNRDSLNSAGANQGGLGGTTT